MQLVLQTGSASKHKFMGTHFCHVSLQSGFCHTCLFHSCLEKTWRVFTDKSAFFMQFTGHHCNLLVTKPVPRFPVQHHIPVCNHSTLMTTSCNHSPANFSAKVFAFNLMATGGRYWWLEKDFSLLDIDGKTFLQPDLCKHFDWWVYGHQFQANDCGFSQIWSSHLEFQDRALNPVLCQSSCYKLPSVQVQTNFRESDVK